MKKRVISILLALVMAFGLCVPALAADEFEAEGPATPVEEEIEVPTGQPMTIAAEPDDEPAPAAVGPVDEPAPAATEIASGTCGAQGNNVKWTLTTDGTLTIYGKGAMHDYKYDYYYGKCESRPWEDYIWTDIINVVIRDGVTSIGDYAFNYCTILTSVSIPDSVTRIGECAFFGCYDLTSVSIPSRVTRIEEGTFEECINLASVMIPVSVTSIGEEAFWVCRSLREVYYGGTQQQWRAVTVGENNGPLTSAAIHYNGTGPAEPTPTPGLDDIQPPAGGTGWRYVPETGDYYYFKNYKRVGDYWVGFADGASKWANNWYYADADGKLLTGFQYLDDLKGGKAWYMLQTTNDRGEIGKMLTGWQYTYTAAGTGYFNPNYGSQGMCTYTSAWGSYNAATGLWEDRQLHTGTLGTAITAERALELADAFSAFSDGETQWISGEKFVIQFWDCGQLERNGRVVYVFQVRRLRAIEGPQMTQLMETICVDAETGECSYLFW